MHGPKAPTGATVGRHVAVVGATGVVGRELLSIVEQRALPVVSMRLFASAASAGSRIPFGGEAREVQELAEASFDEVDIAFFSAGAEISRRFAPAAVQRGTTVIDNSSAFRMSPESPLVIPEVNGGVLQDLEGAPAIIANPNCSTIILLVALQPLRDAFGLERVVVSTYQAASGAGAAAMRELEGQTRAALDGDEVAPVIFPEPCAFNVFSHDSPVDAASGRNVEEQKVIDEARRIWDAPELRIAATCIRVPVLRAHAESINVTLARPATEAEVQDALQGAPGILLVDDRSRGDFPTSLKASGRDEVLVGRVRPDVSQERVEGDAGPAYRGFDLFVCGDQLRKGAALNAVQIAELLYDTSCS